MILTAYGSRWRFGQARSSAGRTKAQVAVLRAGRRSITLALLAPSQTR